MRDDLRGRKFGALTVVQPAPSASKGEQQYPRWVVKCDCGKHRIVYATNLYSGATRSCGCRPANQKERPDRQDLINGIQPEADAQAMAALRKYLAARPPAPIPSDFYETWMP